MKKHLRYLILICIVVLSSCKKDGLAQYQKADFQNNRWYQTQPIVLTFDNKTTQKASINFTMGYVYGSQFAKIPLEVYITNPLHQINKIPVTLQLFDQNKNELGECVGDFCDITQILVKDYNFDEVGVYKIQVLNTFIHEYLPNVNSVSVQVK